MKAHAERFNRSTQEEFIEFHKDLLLQDLDAFNDKLLDDIIWFNEYRPHYALRLRFPRRFLAEEHQCNMYWRDTTFPVIRHEAVVQSVPMHPEGI